MSGFFIQWDDRDAQLMLYLHWLRHTSALLELYLPIGIILRFVIINVFLFSSPLNSVLSSYYKYYSSCLSLFINQLHLMRFWVFSFWRIKPIWNTMKYYHLSLLWPFQLLFMLLASVTSGDHEGEWQDFRSFPKYLYYVFFNLEHGERHNVFRLLIILT